MELNSTPVLLLTGYLGSGKTTLLNRLLNNRRNIRFAVVVNDLGEVNIDADLVERGGIVGQKDENLVALQNGCICCTLKMDLVEQLCEITSQQRFDYIVVEASGICEPAPIAQTIESIPTLGPQYLRGGLPYVDSIVTVVDVLRMRDEFGSGKDLLRPGLAEEDIENLVIQQIEFCDMILLNKASEVSAEELLAVREIVRALQPKAKIVECDYCDVDFDELLFTGRFRFDDVATSAAWIEAIEGHHDDEDEHEEEHHHEEHHDEEEHHHEGHEHHHHHHHDEGEAEEYGISTFVYYRRRAMDIGRFDEFVARHWPKGVIRAKGICWFSSEDEMCYLFEQAGSQVKLKNIGQWYATMPTDELEDLLRRQPDLRRDWDEECGDRMQKLVFIGRDMDRKAISDSLDACLVKA